MKDFNINLTQGLPVMTFDIADSIWNNIYISLTLKQGSFFAAPEFGSKLYTLNRAKNTVRTEQKVKDYCKQALQWLLDTKRALSISIVTERLSGRINFEISVTQANGVPVSFSSFVEVV